MKKVLYDKAWAKTAPNYELYYMYRGLKKKDGLRYDITVIPSRMLGQEFTKTKGHEHVGNNGEIYLVLQGEAVFLLQKRKNGKILDIYAVKTKKGGVCAIPQGYGHLTINPSKNKLVMANWMAEEAKSDYLPYEKYQGAGYYLTEKGWTKNKNYDKVNKLRFKRPLKKLPKNLDFLYGN
ncbi:MAG: glucose-6-phosphate isomerase family protein [Candidatus Nealsonbacteria bacterium]